MLEELASHPTPILLTPGPVQLDASILRAVADSGHLHHRMPSFSRLLQSCHSKFRDVFSIPDCYELVFMGCSGTGMTEAMLRNYKELRKGTVLFLINGHFGSRLAHIAETLGLPCMRLHAEEGRNFSMPEIQRVVEENPQITAIAAVHLETSLGQLNEFTLLAKFCRERSLELLLDMVSSFGGEDIPFASLAPSMAVTVSGKALGSLPGLGCALVHKDVLAQLSQHRLTEHYFSFLPYVEARLRRNEMPFTPPVHLFAAFHQALSLIQDETVPCKLARHREGLRLLTDIAASFGFTAFPCENPSSTTLTLEYPREEAERFDQFHELLVQNGFIPLQNKTTQRPRGHFQLSTMGHVDPRTLEKLAVNLRRAGAGQRMHQPLIMRGEA